MNAKKARKLRKLIDCNLSSNSEYRDHGAVAVGGRIIAQIQPDGNHTEREAPVVEARSTEERHLYRQLKKIYGGSKSNKEIQTQLREDLESKSSTPEDL